MTLVIEHLKGENQNHFSDSFIVTVFAESGVRHCDVWQNGKYELKIV